MKKLSAVSAVLFILLCASTASAASGKAGLALAAGGNFTDVSGGVGTFAGTFFLQQFAVENNKLVGRGILSGTLTSSTGVVIGSVWRQVSMPVTVSPGASAVRSATGIAPIGVAATCDILHLDLGPLDLNVLGLQVNLSEVVLDITAQTGAGNLLGNLLCAVTNLLNGVGSLIDIANLLNQILQILIGLLA